jgi:hypothetical protein
MTDTSNPSSAVTAGSSGEVPAPTASGGNLVDGSMRALGRFNVGPIGF